MTEETKPEQEAKQKPFNEGRPFLLLSIDANGDCSVGGWAHDKPLAYSILEMARDQIKNWHDQNEFKMRQKKSNKIISPVEFFNRFKGNGNGKH